MVKHDSSENGLVSATGNDDEGAAVNDEGAAGNGDDDDAGNDVDAESDDAGNEVDAGNDDRGKRKLFHLVDVIGNFFALRIFLRQFVFIKAQSCTRHAVW